MSPATGLPCWSTSGVIADTRTHLNGEGAGTGGGVVPEVVLEVVLEVVFEVVFEVVLEVSEPGVSETTATLTSVKALKVLATRRYTKAAPTES